MMTRGTFAKKAVRDREEAARKRRAIEAEIGRVPHGELADRRDDECFDAPDEPPPGYARAGGWR